MDYNLAKRLKDAGFPYKPLELNEAMKAQFDEVQKQIKQYESSAMGKLLTQSKFLKDPYEESFNRTGMFVLGDRVYERPTLEDLIDACGDDFKKLVSNPYRWRADGWKSETKEVFGGLGGNPSEAVANLYIALKRNGKDN